MPLIRKRRAPAPAQALSSDEEASSPSDPDPHRKTHPKTQTQPRQRTASPASTASDAATPDETPNPDAPDTHNQTAHNDSVKRLVRLALASEHSRQPIRRIDISSKALTTPRSFRAVFDAAQLELRDKFGMELVELPKREMVTVQQRRKAQQQAAAAVQKTGGGRGRGRGGGGGGGGAALREVGETGGAGNGSGSSGGGGGGPWILVSVLPAKYRTAEIVPPSFAPTAEMEAAYVGLCSFVVSLIYLSQGTLAEPKLERYLRRVNADQTTPVDRTERVLARMVKEGYIVKIKDTSAGEEVVEYMVGPRGKVEIGEEGVKGMTKAVFADDETPIVEYELEKRLEKSLRVASTRRVPGTSAMARADEDEDDD